MCFNEVVNIRNGYSRARYGGEPGQVCPPVKHRQSHLVDPTILLTGHVGNIAAIATATSGMPSLECMPGHVGRTRRQ